MACFDRGGRGADARFLRGQRAGQCTTGPGGLLADESTGNLHPTTATRVMDLLLAQTRGHGASLVLVTHSDAAASRADRVLRLMAEGIAA